MGKKKKKIYFFCLKTIVEHVFHSCSFPMLRKRLDGLFRRNMAFHIAIRDWQFFLVYFCFKSLVEPVFSSCNLFMLRKRLYGHFRRNRALNIAIKVGQNYKEDKTL